MLTKLLNILNTACTILARLLHLKDKADRAKRRKAIVEGDKEAVNKDLDNVLHRALLLLLVPLAFLGGCTTYTVVPADREVLPVERIDSDFFKVSQEGGQVDGWYVPTAVFLDLRDKIKED